jgi:hypothetical protein
MQRAWVGRLGFCVTVIGWFFYSTLEKQNELTHLKIQIPQAEKDLMAIRQENRRLEYEIEVRENPDRLLELAHRPEYSHLRHPLIREILSVPEALAATED